VIKSLFVTFNPIGTEDFGGAQCTQRNLNLLKEVSDPVIYVIKRRSFMSSLTSFVRGDFPPFKKEDEVNIFDSIKVNDVGLVFVDNSLLGGVVEKIKSKFGLPVIVFFNNVEYDYVSVRFRHERVRRFLFGKIAKKQEILSLTFADTSIVLNDRDMGRIEEIYGVKIDYILPVSFNSIMTKTELQNKYSRINRGLYKTCLFVGAYGKANYDGIKWFADVVMPSLERVKLIIVGRGFDKFEKEFPNENIEVIGFVNSLEEYYLKSDFVIAPIFFGAGMKVKIAEAMMYGKSVLGTNEAFEGYEVDFNKVGALCNNAESFESEIGILKNLDNKYNEYSRSIFDAKYSSSVTSKKFKEIFSNL